MDRGGVQVAAAMNSQECGGRQPVLETGRGEANPIQARPVWGKTLRMKQDR